MNIFIVEDDLLFNHFYTMFFQSKGVDTVSAYSIAEAVSVLGNDVVFDAIVLDNQLADGEGLQLVPSLIQKYPDAAILMVSANDSADFFLQAYTAGLDDYAVKPVNVDLLWVKICRAVDVRRLQRISRQQQKELEYWVAQEQQEQELAVHVLATLTQRLQQMPSYIQVKSKPSSSFSGDIFLQQEGHDGSQYILVADAMGHGLAAAISLMPVLEIFQAMSLKSLPLSNLVFELNNKLNRQLPSDRFVAAIFMRLDPRNSSLEVWNGAMPPLLIIDPVQKTYTKAESKNMALGILDEQQVDVAVERFKLTDGCHVVGFTDGLTDSDFPNFGQFSIEKIAEFWFEQANSAFLKIEALINGISQPVDDISIIAIDFDRYAENSLKNISLNEEKDGELLLEYKISGAALVQIDAPLKIAQTLSAYGMRQSLNNTVFSVLTELYLNAFEHGVLNLDSKIKQMEDGFLRYYNLRDTGLAALTSADFITIKVSWNMKDDSIHIDVVDSGVGFDYQSVNHERATDDFYYGRGINMIYSLCSKVNFNGSGNEVNAVIIG